MVEKYSNAVFRSFMIKRIPKYCIIFFLAFEYLHCLLLAADTKNLNFLDTKSFGAKTNS